MVHEQNSKRHKKETLKIKWGEKCIKKKYCDLYNYFNGNKKSKNIFNQIENNVIICTNSENVLYMQAHACVYVPKLTVTPCPCPRQ